MGIVLSISGYPCIFMPCCVTPNCNKGKRAYLLCPFFNLFCYRKLKQRAENTYFVSQSQVAPEPKQPKGTGR